MLLNPVLFKVVKREVWLEWRFVIPLEELRPINASEEWVVFNLGCSLLSSQTMIRLAFEELRYNISSVCRKGFRDLNGIAEAYLTSWPAAR